MNKKVKKKELISLKKTSKIRQYNNSIIKI
jgi:hypothetical protein